MPSFDLEQLGEVSGAWVIVEEVKGWLQKWLPVAVAKLNAAGYHGAGGVTDVMIPPVYYGRVPLNMIDEVADQVPAVMVQSSGTVEDIEVVGTTGFAAWYSVTVTVVDRRNDWDTTADGTQIWAGLVRQVMLANRTLNGKVSWVMWTSETFGAIPDRQGRTSGGCTVTFRIKIPVTALGDLGPLTPDPVFPDPATGIPDPLPDTPVIVEFDQENADAPLP